MAPVTNKCIIFKEFLKGIDDATRTPILGTYVPGQTTAFDDTQTIDVDNVPLNGGILLKTLVLSLELYVLAKMRPGLLAAADTYKAGDTIQSFGVGVVVRTDNPAFQVGNHVFGFCPFAEYSVQSNPEGYSKIDNKHNLPWNVFVGIAGVPGQTAYAGWKEYARAKEGEVAFVTSGAGAVGSMVIQLAKLDGMKVIACAGTDDKVQFLKELGADVAFNYKTTKTAEVLAKEGPIDVYWDNVGGETLEAALNAAARYARFIQCGMLSGYFHDSTYPIRTQRTSPGPNVSQNIVNVLLKEISMHGFIVFSLLPKYLEAFQEQIPKLAASKKLIYREEVTRGLENAEAALDKFLKGANTGKGIVVVADEL